MLIDYVDAAARFARCKTKEQFLSEFGEMTRAVLGLYEGMSRDADAIGEAIYALHKRHGDGVMKVVAQMLAQNPELYPLKNQRGMSHIHTLLQHPGDFLSSTALTSIAEGHPVAADSLQISLDADQEAVNSIRDIVQELNEELDEAKEFCNDDEVARIEMDLEQYGKWLAEETRRGGKAGRELKSVKKSRDRVSKAIRLAIKGIKKHSAPLAAHLADELDSGNLMRYRRTGLAWDLEPRPAQTTVATT